MPKQFTKIQWENWPSLVTPINDANLMRLENGIDVNDTRIAGIEDALPDLIASSINQAEQIIIGDLTDACNTATANAETATNNALDAAAAAEIAGQDASQSAQTADEINTTVTQAETARQTFYNAYKVCEPYNSTKDYVPGNKVTSAGSTYQNLVACKGVAPVVNQSSTNWLIIAQKGQDGTGGDMYKSVYDQQGKAQDFYLYADSKTGDLSQLPTTDKTSLVNSMKELESKKVDKVDGQGLSSNDYTSSDKSEVAKIAGLSNTVMTNYSTLDTKINSQASGSPKGVYATLSALQTAFPTGNSNIYLVTADGKWYYWNGAAWTAGGTYQSTGIADASISKAKLDTNLSSLATNTQTIFDNKSVYSTLEYGYNFVTDDNGTGTTKGFKESSAVTTNYTPNIDMFSCVTNNANRTLSEFFFPNADLKKVMSNGGLTIRFNIESTNLIVQNLRLELFSMKGTTFTLVKQSTIIPTVVVNTIYQVDLFVDSSLIPSDAEAFRIYIDYETYVSGSDIFISKYNINLGNTVGNSELGTARKNSIKYIKDAVGINKWFGKTWNAVGDSITSAELYTKKVINDTGLVCNNYGMGASTVSINNSFMSNKSILERVKGLNGNAAAVDADLWTIFGGTNDWNLLTPVGTISSTDNTTFYGALKELCEYIIGRPNNPKLILFTPLQSNRNGANTNGITMQSYRQAIKDVGDYYSIPVLDLYGIGGINLVNVNVTTSDGVHPTDKGTILYYPKIVAAINNL